MMPAVEHEAHDVIPHGATNVRALIYVLLPAKAIDT